MIKMVEEQAIPQLSIEAAIIISASSEEQTASMEEITATAHKLGALAEELKNKLTKYEVV